LAIVAATPAFFPLSTGEISPKSEIKILEKEVIFGGFQSPEMRKQNKFFYNRHI
jgi:hypothetical protein